MDFKAIRKEYENSGLDRDQLIADPIDQLRKWLQLAMDQCPEPWFEPNAMTLATTDPGQHVSARIVLLKEINESGIIFYTNYDSAKGRAMAECPLVAVVLHWPYLSRQVRMVGSVSKTTREKSETYFHSRPRGSQIGALISEQSTTVDSREQLETAASAAEERYDGQEIPLPENWGGYQLTVTEFEFWQGREDRIHDRFVYSQVESGWEIRRLSP